MAEGYSIDWSIDGLGYFKDDLHIYFKNSFTMIAEVTLNFFVVVLWLEFDHYRYGVNVYLYTPFNEICSNYIHMHIILVQNIFGKQWAKFSNNILM